MLTSLKYEALKGMTREQQIMVLKGAISMEMAKPALAIELAGPEIYKGYHAANGAGMKRPAPSIERIKNFLAAKYATTSNNPVLNDVANEFEQFFHTNMPEMDLGFTALFNLVDLRNSTHDHFDIIDTNAGLSWSQRLPGEETKIRRNITEAKTTVGFLEFSDGLGLLDVWLDFQQFWNIDEAIAEFRSTYYDKMASTHYSLFTAQGTGIDIPFATDDPTTLNNAASDIIRKVKNKGYAVSATAEFYIVCSIEKVGRLQRMLTAQVGSPIVAAGTVSQPIGFSIKGIIASTQVTAADTGYYLVLPGRKIKRGAWKDLTIESARNATVSATDLVGVGRYNAAVGDSDQVRRVKYA